jgi:hypothetical protein
VHAHTCLGCTAVLARGEFDCDYDAEHDFALCHTCASVRESIYALTKCITPRDLALQVAEALDNPDTWCAGAFARDAAGNELSYCDPAAVRWCAAGHALRLGGHAAADDLDLAYALLFRTSMLMDNDRHGRECVRDRLLELANS